MLYPHRDGSESCSDCEAGPSGIVGHDRLYSHTMTGKEMQFACRACGRFWARSLAGSEPHAWREVNAPSGEDVPGRPGTTPP